MLNIIMVVSFVPIWPILFFFIRNYAKPHKLIILGVTLPQSVHDDPRVLEIINGFKKWLNITMLPLFVLMFLPFFSNSMGFAMTWYMIWLMLIIVFPIGTYAVFRSRLMTLKRENDWYSEASNKTLVDIKAAAIPAQKINGIWFLLPVIISLFPLVYIFTSNSDPSMLSIYITFAAMTILFWPLYYIIFKLRSEIVDENLTLTMALTRVRRYNWGKFWLVMIWATGILNPLIWLFESSPMAFLYLTLGYTMLVLIVAIQTEFATRKAQQNLTADGTGELYVDEDELWIWGFIYNNPNDKHFIVNYRVGIGMSVNFAKPAGKILMGFAALTIVLMPFFGIWMWVEEATPAHLVLSTDAITARHTSDMYVIPLNDIESIELIEQRADLPYIITRTNGTSFENLNKGRFSVRGYGSTFLLMQPKDPPFIIIVANGQAYILNDADSNVTREVYNQLKYYAGEK